MRCALCVVCYLALGVCALLSVGCCSLLVVRCVCCCCLRDVCCVLPVGVVVRWCCFVVLLRLGILLFVVCSIPVVVISTMVLVWVY